MRRGPAVEQQVGASRRLNLLEFGFFQVFGNRDEPTEAQWMTAGVYGRNAVHAFTKPTRATNETAERLLVVGVFHGGLSEHTEVRRRDRDCFRARGRNSALRHFVQVFLFKPQS